MGWLWLVRHVLLAGVSCLVAQAAVAQDAVEAMRRMQAAALSLDYAGTFTHHQGNQVVSSRVLHVSDTSGEHERLEILDGKPREYIRHNNRIQGFMPDKKLVLVERLTSRDRFPAVLSGSPEQVLRSYLVESAGLDRVAGRECQQWLFKPRDELRYAYRLCTDVASGLLLRAQTLDAQHRLIEQVSFTELRIGGGINRDELKPRWNTEGWTVRESQVVPIDLGNSGWTLPDVAGFRRTLELRRPLGDRGDVIQVVMSDGLSSLSLFIEPMDTGSALPEGASQAGVVNMYRRKSSQHWITAVGEVPTQTLQRTVEALQHRAPTR